MKKVVAILIGFVAVFVCAGCSLKEMAIRTVADSLTGDTGDVFTGDNDPDLIEDSLPFALKLYEALLEKTPDHQGLILTTGSGYVMYANAFLQSKALMLPLEEYETKVHLKKRAVNLYIRGRDILLEGLERNHPGIAASKDDDTTREILLGVGVEDTALLYWAAAGWMGAYSLDPFTPETAAGITKAVLMIKRAYELDPDFSNGAIHDLLIQYYASFPMEKDLQKAKHHFKAAVEISGGLLASPYVSYATSVSIQKQDAEEFVDLLETALDIDVDKAPDSRLANIISQRKAQWYLENIENFFLLDSEDGGE
jgi:predicted anti-sigma-YlaC factor YlaD